MWRKKTRGELDNSGLRWKDTEAVDVRCKFVDVLNATLNHTVPRNFLITLNRNFDHYQRLLFMNETVIEVIVKPEWKWNQNHTHCQN